MDENRFDALPEPREMKFWIQTASGRQVDLLDPKPEQISIQDVAHSLARLCRYNGHVPVPIYSVAEHSVRVLWIVSTWIEMMELGDDDVWHMLSDVEGVGEADGPGGKVANVKKLALLHDGHEYILGDMCAPQKHVLRHMANELGIPDVYAILEAKHDHAARSRFGLQSGPLPEIVKKADLAVLGAEANDILEHKHLHTFWKVGNMQELSDSVPQGRCRPQGWSVERSQYEFLLACTELGVV